MLGSELLRRAPATVEALGTDLVGARPGASTEAPEVADVGRDLADEAQVDALFEELAPLAGVIHAAAYTAVDQAEAEPEAARRANALAAETVAAACARSGAALVLVSTDFVFDGKKRSPYREDDPAAPAGVYGRTKLEGELRARAACPDGLRVVRTQWLYGPRGKHFPGTILRLAAEREELRVVDDQIGVPTSTLELAPALWDVLERAGPGTWHAACRGAASWYELARATLELAGSETRVVPCSSAEFPRPAPRPAYSVLECSKLAELRGRPLAPWRSALEDFFRHPEGPLAGGPLAGG
jgi:dTDP-4-dehydrorhamnose reductase